MTTPTHNIDTILSSNDVETLDKAIRSAVGSVNRGEKAKGTLDTLALETTRDILKAMDLAPETWKEPSTGDADAGYKAVAEFMKTHFKGPKDSKAESYLSTLRSRCARMAHRGVCPYVTRITVPVVKVTIQDGDKATYEHSETEVVIDSVSKWAQVLRSKPTSGSKDATYIAGASSTFETKSKDNPGLKRDMRRGLQKARVKAGEIASEDAAEPAKEPVKQKWDGGCPATGITTSQAREIDAIVAALKLVPTGKPRANALDMLKRVKVELEMLAHATAAEAANG